MRTPQLGLLALLGLLLFSCANPGGTDPAGTTRKRPAPPEPTAKASATPGPGASATPTPGGGTPTPAPAAEPTEGPYFARVHDADDAPVRGATVRAYLDDGVAPIKMTTTDANGRFVLEGLAVWPVNLEVVGPITGKVYQRQVGADTQKLTLTLAPAGRLTGQVTAPALQAAPDFSDVTVRVLGTSYKTTAASDGAFVFESLPAGTFTIAAEGPLLGAATPDDVTVESAATAEADLVVAPTAPMIGSLTPAHGGPGSEVTIQGTAFGAEASGAASVTFGGVAAASPQRLSATEIRAVVPAGAANGDVVVTLGGKLPSAGKAFRVLKELTINGPTGTVTAGQTAAFTVEARDTADALVAAPGLTGWRSSNQAVATVDAAGTLSALAPGETILSITSGTLEATRAVTVVAP